MSKVFIVIEPDPVVCMDVEGLLGSRYPDALVWASASLQADTGGRTGGPASITASQARADREGRQAGRSGALVALMRHPQARPVPRLLNGAPW